ncbi:MAG TPA: hypothetical protein PLX06_05165 [Fimbriimonadaceae bacterium]|nr:hypothetical protein [Fimbriimonadaceae bacterium]
MIKSLLALTLGIHPGFAPPTQQSPEAHVKAAAVAFLRTASNILAPGSSPIPLRTEFGAVHREEDEPGTYMFTGEAGIVFVEQPSGKILHATLHQEEPDEEWRAAARIPDETAFSILRELTRAARYGPEIQLVKTSRSASRPAIDIWAVPVIQGVPYAPHHGVMATLHYRTGRLITGSFRKFPVPPANVVATPNLAAARTAILADLFSRKRVDALLEESAPKLVLWRPQPLGIAPEDRFLNASHQDLASQNKAILAIRASYADEGSFSASRNDLTSRFHCYVDARTGRLLNVDHLYPAGGGAGARLSEHLSTFSWNWPLGSVQTLDGKRSITVAKAAVKGVEGTFDSDGARNVVLIRGKRSYRASYQPKQGVLMLQLGRRQVLGRPNKALASRLGAGSEPNQWQTIRS